MSDLSSSDPGLRERKRRQTADHIAATAFRLFEAHGYESVTMEQIAAKADVSKGTLYNYFPVKEALVAYQFRVEIATGMADLGEALRQQPTFATRMTFLLRASAEWNKGRRAYLPHYLRFRWTNMSLGSGRSVPDEYSSGTFRILEALFREGQKVGEVRSDLTSKHLAMSFELLLTGAISVWLDHPEMDLARNFEDALELLLHGAASAGSPATSTRPSRQKKK
jgi:AcrR family transcriptional regulator